MENNIPLRRRLILVILIASLVLIFRIVSTQAAMLLTEELMQVSTPDSGYVEVNDGRIFYESSGQGPTIVMIHDGLLHRETWNDQFGPFAKNHRVIRN